MKYQYGSYKVFCEGGKIVLFIYPAVGRLIKMAGFPLYYATLNWTLMQENIKTTIPTAIYAFRQIWQIIIGLSVYYVTVNLTLTEWKYHRKKKYVSFNVTTMIIKCQLFSLNIVCSICFNKTGNFTPSVSSTANKFEHCHYIRCGYAAQYSKVSLSAVSTSDK